MCTIWGSYVLRSDNSDNGNYSETGLVSPVRIEISLHEDPTEEIREIIYLQNVFYHPHNEPQ